MSTRICTDLFPYRYLLSWYKKSSRKLPWRREITPYRVWAAEIMLQQTQVKNVIPYYNRFIEKFPNLKSLSKAQESEIMKLWSGLGYYQRARNMLKTAKILTEKYNGRFPKDSDALLKLPGIGNYTAGAILSIAFNLPAPIFDGNVRRVLSRFYAERAQSRLLEMSEKLISGLQEHVFMPRDFNQSLMELGAMVCLPKKPLCPSCPIRLNCKANQQGLQSFFPPLTKRQNIISKFYAVAVLIRGHLLNGRIFIRQRSYKEQWLKGLWELPMVELPPQNFTDKLNVNSEQNFEQAAKIFCREINFPVAIEKYAGAFTHSITYHRLKIMVFVGRFMNSVPMNGNGKWISIRQVSDIPSSSILKKSLALVFP